MHDEVVKAASHAKVLGVDTVGGCKRCTFQQRSRIWTFSGMQSKFSALREIGLDVLQMVRAIAPPLMLYGVENICISDTLLHTVRVKSASAKGSSTAGKNPDVSLALTDGASGVADAAFNAHSNPLKYWSLVFWEHLFYHDALCEVLQAAKKRIKQSTPTDLN